MKLNRLLTDVVENNALWTDEKLPFSAAVEPGHPRVAVIAGENATGKSLFARILAAGAHHRHKLSPISVSIRERTGCGLDEMARFRQAMMFGDENEQSTGAASAKVLEAAFRNVHSRAEEGKSAVLILDEPELGLSDGYAAAMGTYLAEQAEELPKKACGLVVVTHSRTLTQALIEGLGILPTFVKTGDAQSFADWLEGERARTVEELLALPKLGHEQWRTVDQILRDRRKSA